MKKDERLPEDPESQPHKGKRRGEQKSLPGVLEKTVQHPDVTRLAKQIKALRSERGEISAKLKRLNATMAEKMKKLGMQTYVTDTLIVECDSRDVISIRAIGDDEGEGSEAA